MRFGVIFLLDLVHRYDITMSGGKGHAHCTWLRRIAQNTPQGAEMDIVVLAIGILFFALSFAYVRACDNL